VANIRLPLNHPSHSTSRSCPNYCHPHKSAQYTRMPLQTISNPPAHGRRVIPGLGSSSRFSNGSLALDLNFAKKRRIASSRLVQRLRSNWPTSPTRPRRPVNKEIRHAHPNESKDNNALLTIRQERTCIRLLSSCNT
jgi:hypothetical protein